MEPASMKRPFTPADDEGDSYVVVTTKLRGVQSKSIFVDKPASRGSGEVSIPRSLIHGVDEWKLDKAPVGSEITFRMFLWKAEELGFA